MVAKLFLGPNSTKADANIRTFKSSRAPYPKVSYFPGTCLTLDTSKPRVYP